MPPRRNHSTGNGRLWRGRLRVGLPRRVRVRTGDVRPAIASFITSSLPRGRLRGSLACTAGGWCVSRLRLEQASVWCEPYGARVASHAPLPTVRGGLETEPEYRDLDTGPAPGLTPVPSGLGGSKVRVGVLLQVPAPGARDGRETALPTLRRAFEPGLEVWNGGPLESARACGRGALGAYREFVRTTRHASVGIAHISSDSARTAPPSRDTRPHRQRARPSLARPAHDAVCRQESPRATRRGGKRTLVSLRSSHGLRRARGPDAPSRRVRTAHRDRDDRMWGWAR